MKDTKVKIQPPKLEDNYVAEAFKNLFAWRRKERLKRNTIVVLSILVVIAIITGG